MAAVAGALRGVPWVDRHAITRWQQRHGSGGAISAIKQIVASGIEVGPDNGPAWFRRYVPGFRYFVPRDGREAVVSVVKDISPDHAIAITVLTPMRPCPVRFD